MSGKVIDSARNSKGNSGVFDRDEFLSSSSGIVNTVCNAGVSSSHTGHNFSAYLAKTYLPPNDSPQIQIFPV